MKVEEPIKIGNNKDSTIDDYITLSLNKLLENMILKKSKTSGFGHIIVGNNNQFFI